MSNLYFLKLLSHRYFVFDERTVNLFRCQTVSTAAAILLTTVFPQGISLAKRGVFQEENSSG